jgi:hypothetical protein
MFTLRFNLKYYFSEINSFLDKKAISSLHKLPQVSVHTSKLIYWKKKNLCKYILLLRNISLFYFQRNLSEKDLVANDPSSITSNLNIEPDGSKVKHRVLSDKTDAFDEILSKRRMKLIKRNKSHTRSPLADNIS